MGNNSVCCRDNLSNLQQTERVQIQAQTALPSSTSPPAFASEVLPQWHTNILTYSSKMGMGEGCLESELGKLRQNQEYLVTGEMFFGQLDEEKQATGFGALCKADGTYYVGEFRHGKAEGWGFYFIKERCYYSGEMVDNKAHCAHGHYQNKELEYDGGFQLSEFHGLGHEKGGNYEFNGYFEAGQRKQGELKWTEEGTQYLYKGSLDENGKFAGRGKLKDELGSFQGDFVAGKKEGYGVYRFNSGMRYQGYYKHNLKHGRGQVVNKNGTIAFAGEFRDGLPQGQGYATDAKGNKYSLHWYQAEYALIL